MKIDYKNILSELETISKKVGDYILLQRRNLSGLKVEDKDGAGPVTKIDQDSEALIIKYLMDFNSKYSIDAKFLGEEGSYKSSQDIFDLKKCQYLWVIDPLDGTTNFIHGLDYWAVSIALVENQKPVVGSVYRPTSGEFYGAAVNQNSFKKFLKSNLSIRPLPDKNRPQAIGVKLKNSLLATGFVLEKGVGPSSELELFTKMIKSVRAIRRLGCASLDLCMVAEGIFDGFWERGLPPWDTAAGSLICQKASRSVTRFNGSDFSIFEDQILACSQQISSEMIDLLDHFSR